VSRQCTKPSNIIPDLIFRIVQNRGKPAFLRVHQVASFRAIASLAKVADEIEHLAGERIGQQLHLAANQIGDRHAGLRVVALRCDERPGALEVERLLLSIGFFQAIGQ
jgi:hypothetical protein